MKDLVNPKKNYMDRLLDRLENIGVIKISEREF